MVKMYNRDVLVIEYSVRVISFQYIKASLISTRKNYKNFWKSNKIVNKNVNFIVSKFSSAKVDKQYPSDEVADRKSKIQATCKLKSNP